MRASAFLRLTFLEKRHLPILLQSESAECGLACIAMVASYWGHEIDIPRMRRRFSVSLKGTTLKGLMTMAQAMGLQTRPLKLDLDQLGQLKLPCVLHWDMNHFVVLKSVAKSAVKVHDPAVGQRTVSIAEFSKHFTGVALEAIPGGAFEQTQERQQFTYAQLVGRIVGLASGLWKILLLGLALQVVALVSPFYIQWIVDEALVSADRNLITVLGTGFTLLAILQASIAILRSWITSVLATSIKFQWYGNVFGHLLRLPLAYFEKRHLGDIVSRFGSINTVQNAITTQMVEGVIDGLLVILTLAAMSFYSVSLAGVACAAVGIYAILRWRIFRILQSATAEQLIKSAKQQTLFLESIRGIQTIRLFNRADERRAVWMNVLAEQMNAEVRISRFSISYQTANTLLFGTERVFTIWLAALLVLDRRFSIGMLFAFISYRDQFSQRIASLIDKLFDLRMLRVQGERLADMVLTKPEVDLPDAEIEMARLKATIEVKNLTFRYADAEPFVLNNLSLTIPEGQCVAMTGVSGCGKTTFVKVLLGLLAAEDGEILIGGFPLGRIGLSNYRQIVGSVMQDDGLFSGSIADNITFFDPRPNQDRIEECARLAAIDMEIKAMPMGYLTLIGDLGSGLSGGQKQRLILARALYRRPRILVLDEATSHLDVGNEKIINTAITGLSMTRIIVAHRSETIAMAERIVVLDQGRIVQDVMNPSRRILEAQRDLIHKVFSRNHGDLG